jgi:perosamine synthetase
MSVHERIPIASPILNGNEKKYVNDCLDTAWISSAGKYVARFEEAFASFCGTKYALACANGTVSLHLSLAAIGIGQGDEVIVPTFTYIATANVVKYCGATPIFVDCDDHTWNIDPEKIENKITSRTKAIIPVHLYGLMCDMDPIMDIAERYHLYVIEDAAESHGAEYKGRKSGSFGHANSFSLFGNKIITTGEGGIITTDDSELYAKMKLLRGQGMSAEKRYWFTDIGFNYRMTNIAAAIGLSQLENIHWHLEKRNEIADIYHHFFYELDGAFQIQQFDEKYKHAYWMISILLNPDCKIERDDLMIKLDECGVETRPLFYPLHIMPPYYEGPGKYPVSEDVSARGLNLPSHGRLTERDIRYIVDCLKDIIY